MDTYVLTISGNTGFVAAAFQELDVLMNDLTVHAEVQTPSIIDGVKQPDPGRVVVRTGTVISVTVVATPQEDEG